MYNDKISGTVFRARCVPKSPEGLHYVFVPDSYFRFNEQDDGDPSLIAFHTFDEETFRISRWPHLNAIANGHAEGGHLMPNLENLLPDEEALTGQFKKFEAALDQAVREFQRPSPL